MEGQGKVVGQKAPDFTLANEAGEQVSLSSFLEKGAVLLVFYPGDFTPVCTRQLCNYRDNFDSFSHFGIQLVGISANTVESHKKFKEEYDINFPLLSDPGKKVTKLYGCQSLFMFGGTSRAVMIINKNGIILYRYVEPVPLTRRKADELSGIIKDLRTNQLI